MCIAQMTVVGNTNHHYAIHHNSNVGDRRSIHNHCKDCHLAFTILLQSSHKINNNNKKKELQLVAESILSY